MKLFVAGSVVAALCMALSVHASETPGESWFRFASSSKGSRLKASKDAKSAFERAGTTPEVISAARYNPSGAVSWSQSGRFVAMTTYETQNTLGTAAEPPGVWILDGLDGEPVYYREGAFVDVALVGEADALLTVAPGSPRRVEWTSLRRDGLPLVVSLPEKFEAESISAASAGGAYVVRSGKVSCVGISDSPTQPTCFSVGLHRAALSNDGSRLLGTEGNAFTIRDAQTGALRSRRGAEKNSPLAVSGDGQRVAYLRGGSLVVAHAESGATISQFRIAKSEEDDWAPITVLALDHTGERVAILSSLGQLMVAERAGQALLHLLVSTGVSGFEEQNNGPLAFAPDGDHLHAGDAVVSISKKAVVEDGQPGSPPVGGRRGLRFSTDGSQLGAEHFYYSLAANKESTKEAFDSANRLVELSEDGRFRVDWSKDGKALLAADSLRPDWNAVIWKRPANGGRPVTRLLPDRVTLLLVSPRDGAEGEVISLVDLRTGKTDQEIEALSGCSSDTIDLSEEGRRMVLECSGKPYLWDFVSARPTQLSEDYVEGLSFAGPNQVVFTEEKGRVLLDLKSHKRKIISPATAGLNCRGQAVDGMAVTCHEDGLRVWDRAREVVRIPARAEDVSFWSFAPKNNVVLDFSDRIEIHSLETKKLVATLRGRVVSAPDGSFQIIGPVPEPRCRYGNYVLPFEVCEKRYRAGSLLQRAFR